MDRRGGRPPRHRAVDRAVPGRRQRPWLAGASGDRRGRDRLGREHNGAGCLRSGVPEVPAAPAHPRRVDPSRACAGHRRDAWRRDDADGTLSRSPRARARILAAADRADGRAHPAGVLGIYVASIAPARCAGMVTPDWCGVARRSRVGRRLQPRLEHARGAGWHTGPRRVHRLRRRTVAIQV